MRDDELRDLFSEMRDEPVPGESLARVRMAVGEAVSTRRRVFGARWKVAVLLAAAGFAGVVMLELSKAPRIGQAAVVETPVLPVQAPVEELAPEQVVEKPVVRKKTRIVATPVVEKTPAPVDARGASEIRIESPYEPDVVILLIGG